MVESYVFQRTMELVDCDRAEAMILKVNGIYFLLLFRKIPSSFILLLCPGP